MHFISLYIQGFKSYKDPVTFEFNEGTNTIEGMNGRGKSSIMDALSVCILNKTANGEAKIEDAINLESERYILRAVVQDHEGSIHTIERTRDAKNMTLTIDGREASQGDVDKIVRNPDIFACVFNPHYFHNELTDSERRDIVLAHMPPVDYHQLWQEHVGELDLINKYQVNFTKPDESSRFSKLIKNKEAERVSKSAELSTISAELATAKNAAKDSPVAPDTARLDELKSEFEELSRRANDYSMATAQWQFATDALESAKVKIGAIELTEEQAREFAAMSIDIFKAKRSELQFSPLIPVQDNCSQCGAGLSKEQMAEIMAKNDAIHEKNISIREEMDKMDRAIEKINRARECAAIYDEVAGRQAMVNAGAKNMESLLAGQSTDELNSRIQELQAEITELSNQVVYFEACQKTAADDEARITRHRNRIDSLNQEINALDGEIATLRRIYDAIKGSGSIRTAIKNMHAASFEASLENCTVILEKELKKGGTTECFEIAYHGKPFRRLSTAEKVRCSMEIGRYLCNQAGIQLPVFIDNAEGIINIGDEDFSCCSQWFECYVRDGVEQVRVNEPETVQ